MKTSGGQSRPASILFACGMNAVRSPIAAELTRHLFPKMLYVQSVGLYHGRSDPFAVSVMDEIGLDIAHHEPVTFDDIHDSFFDLIISLSKEANDRAKEWVHNQAIDVEYWPTEDPSLCTGSREQKLDAYRAMRNGLKARLLERFG